MSMLRRVASVLGARVRVVFEPTEKERRLHVAGSNVYTAPNRGKVSEHQLEADKFELPESKL